MLGRSLGHYRILEPLAEGGMGSVWRAEDSLLGRRVALKLLPESLADSAPARKRFLREARLASGLHHPGLVTLFEAGEDNGHLFLVFELIEGRTVRELVRGGPMPVEASVRIAAEAAEALAHAHARAVVHRDVSPGNLMVSREGHTVVIDFGLALAANSSRITSSRSTVGTLPYVPPEAIRGGMMDSRGDVYGLGAVLYEMVTGRPPFRADQTAALLYAVLHEELKRPSALRPGVDPRLDDAILTALARDPDVRFARIEDFAQSLRAIGGGHAIAADDEQAGRMAELGRAPVALARTEVAVLPFKQVGAPAGDGSADEQFARGISEVLSTSLARFGGLQVVPPGQAASAEGAPWRDVARRLGVPLILTGTVRRSQAQLRVSFSLIDGWAGEQVAADMVEGPVSDLFAFEDRLLASVIRALKLEAIETARVPREGEPSSHEKYLTALGYLQRTDQEASVDHAIRLLEEISSTEGATPLVDAALGRAFLRKFELSFEPEWKSRAETSCRRALALDPHSADVLVTLGSVLYRSGRHDESITVIRQSIDLNPLNADAWIRLSYARDAAGDLGGAEQAALEAVAIRPSEWHTHDRLALVRFRKGAFGAAAASWNRTAELVPDNAMVIANLGSAYYHLGRLEDAEREYRRSIEIAPTASAFSWLGTVLFISGRGTEAVAMFQKAVALKPMDARTWGNLGDAQRWTDGLRAESVASLERAVTLARKHLAANTNDAEEWSRLGKWLAKLGRSGDSLEAIRRALGIAGEKIAIQARAITVFELAGDREQALEYLERALAAAYSRLELERDPELESLRKDPRAAALFGARGN